MHPLKGCVVVILVYIFYWIKASCHWRVQVDVAVGLPHTATSKAELNKEFLLHYFVLPLQQQSLSCTSLCRTGRPTLDLRGQLLQKNQKKTFISEVHFSWLFGHVGVAIKRCLQKRVWANPSAKMLVLIRHRHKS